MTPGAPEQPEAKLLLQARDRLREPGLGDVQPRRCPAEVQLIGDYDEVAQVAKLGRCLKRLGGGVAPALADGGHAFN
jgi:hypothetical protein